MLNLLKPNRLTMTDHEATANSVCFEGVRMAWKQLTVAGGEADSNSQLILGQTES